MCLGQLKIWTWPTSRNTMLVLYFLLSKIWTKIRNKICTWRSSLAGWGCVTTVSGNGWGEGGGERADYLALESDRTSAGQQRLLLLHDAAAYTLCSAFPVWEDVFLCLGCQLAMPCCSSRIYLKCFDWLCTIETKHHLFPLSLWGVRKRMSSCRIYAEHT